MAISAYVQASSVLQTAGTRDFATKTLDRILTDAWSEQDGLAHVVAYAEGEGGPRIAGVLDDYALMVHACIDTWERTLELRYYEAAQEYGAQAVVRITADCPLFDGDLLNQMLETFEFNEFNKKFENKFFLI